MERPGFDSQGYESVDSTKAKRSISGFNQQKLYIRMLPLGMSVQTDQNDQYTHRASVTILLYRAVELALNPTPANLYVLPATRG